MSYIGESLQTYRWSKPQQEMILFAFFVGYTSMMLPMGMLAQKVGGKLPICAALFINGVLSVLTPWMPLVVSINNAEL